MHSAKGQEWRSVFVLKAVDGCIPSDLARRRDTRMAGCCAAKEVLRRYLGPKFDRRLALFLAKAILERMRLTKWRVSRESPDPPHSTPGK
jgi:superfamily I DNA/RNA helicase